MCRIACIVACCLISWTVCAGDASTYLGSIDTNPIVPTSFVVNPSNNKIYVAGSTGSGAKVKVINCASGTTTELAITGATSIPSMAYDPSSNKIYVATTSSILGIITCSDATLNSTDSVATATINGGANVNNIEQIAVDPGRRLILSGRDTIKIQVIPLPLAAATTASGSNTCTAIAVDSKNNVSYIAENSNASTNTVFRTAAGAAPVAYFAINTSASNVLAMTVADGERLFVSTGKGELYYSAYTSSFSFPAPSSAFNFSSLMNAPTASDMLSSMAYNSTTKKLYIVNSTQGRVYVLNVASPGAPTPVASIPVNLARSVTVNPNTNRIFVTAGANTLVTIDGSTDTTASIDSNSTATTINRVALNPVTNRVYAMESANAKVHVFDGALNTVTSRIDSASYDINIAFSAINNKTGILYGVESTMGPQANAAPAKVYRINGTTVTFGTAGVTPVDIGVNEKTSKVYVANQADNTLTKFDGTTMVPTTIQLNSGGLTAMNPVALAVDPVVNRIFVANKGTGNGVGANISVVYGGSDQVISTLPLDGEPTALCVVPSRSKLYVATKMGDQGFVTIFSTLENKLIRKLTVQENPQQLLQAGTDRVYVSSLTSAAVIALDSGNDNSIGSITCGNSNNVMAYSATNGMLYVVSRSSSGNLTAIDVSSNTTRQSPTSAGSSPAGIAVDNSGNRVYVAQQSGVVTVLDGGVNPFQLTSVNTFTTQGSVNAVTVDPIRGKLYLAGMGLRSVDIESGQFGPSTSTVGGDPIGIYYNNTPGFNLSSNGNPSLYYQLDSTQGAWTRGTDGMNQTLFSSVPAGSHILYAFRSNNFDGTLANNAIGSNSPVIDKIDAFPFIVHDAGFPLPTLNAIEDQSITEDQGQVLINFFGVTPGPLDTVFSSSNITVVTSNSNPANLVSIVSPVDFDSARGLGTLKITPAADLNGDVLITVRVTDPTGTVGVSAPQLTIARTFKLTVRPVNDAPTFTPGANITVTEAAVQTSVPNFITGVVLGPSNESTQAISQYIVAAAAPLQFKVQPSIDTAGNLTFTPANNASAATPISISVQLKDNGGTTDGGVDTSAVKTFTITLTPVADTLIVMNTSDDGAANSNSLRDCMTRARSGDTITFDADVFDLTNSNAATVINVTGGGLPALNDGNVTIEASDRRVTVNGTGTVDASGILIQSSNNTIHGLSIVGFPGPGLRIQGGASNTIGGSRTSGTGPNGQGLRISGNGSFGLEIRGATATANVVKGCWIGLDSAGTSAEANLAGILIQDSATGNTIGGTASGETNVIGGNKFEGTTFSGTGTDDNTFVANQVGISAVDTTSTTSSSTLSRATTDVFVSRNSVANGSAGLFLSRGTKNSRVGGDSDSEGNVVANNGGNGVEVRAAGSRRNAAKKNRISKNKSGGIALFDSANDGILAPTFTSVSRRVTASLSRATSSTVSVTISGTASTSTGTIEIFNDSGSQGATFVSRASVTANTWTADVDVSDVLNITATLTDDNGNTSQFAVYGRSPGSDSGVDTDGDGISDALETLAGTDPNSADSVPVAGGALIVDKLAIGLNFAKSNKDTLKATIRLVLPTGYINTDAVVAVQFADSTASVTLTSKGASVKGAAATVKLTGGSTTAAAANTGARITYSLAKQTLLTSLQSAGLDNETTAKAGETDTVPVAVSITSGTTTTVYTGTINVKYKATTGKTGKAAQSL